MRPIITIANELNACIYDEAELGQVLHELETDHCFNTSWSFSEVTQHWSVVLSTGNDLFYFGEKDTLALAIADALTDYLDDD